MPDICKCKHAGWCLLSVAQIYPWCDIHIYPCANTQCRPKHSATTELLLKMGHVKMPQACFGEEEISIPYLQGLRPSLVVWALSRTPTSSLNTYLAHIAEVYNLPALLTKDKCSGKTPSVYIYMGIQPPFISWMLHVTPTCIKIVTWCLPPSMPTSFVTHAKTGERIASPVSSLCIMDTRG